MLNKDINWRAKIAAGAVAVGLLILDLIVGADAATHGNGGSRGGFSGGSSAGFAGSQSGMRSGVRPGLAGGFRAGPRSGFAGGLRGGIFLRGPLFDPFWYGPYWDYDYPYYYPYDYNAYPYYYSPANVDDGTTLWYCNDPAGYYPAVPSCNVQWRQVATPPPPPPRNN